MSSYEGWPGIRLLAQRWPEAKSFLKLGLRAAQPQVQLSPQSTLVTTPSLRGIGRRFVVGILALSTELLYGNACR